MFFHEIGQLPSSSCQPQDPGSEFEGPLADDNAVDGARAPRLDGDQESRGASKVPHSDSQLLNQLF